jgi:hypothetical protein
VTVVLAEFLDDVDQRHLLGEHPVPGYPRVVGHGLDRVGGACAGEVVEKVPFRRLDSPDKIGQPSACLEFRVAVAAVLPAGDEMPHPEFDDAKAVREDLVRGVGVGKVGTPVRQFVAQLGDDPDHVVQGPVDEEDVVIAALHVPIVVVPVPVTLWYALHRVDRVGPCGASVPCLGPCRDLGSTENQ